MIIFDIIKNFLTLDEKIENFQKATLTNIVLGLLVSLLIFTAILFTGSFFYELLLVENFTSLEAKGIIILSLIVTIASIIYFFFPKKIKKEGSENLEIEELVDEFMKGFMEGGKNEK